MVLGCQHDVFLSRRFRQADDFVSVVLHGIELRRQLLVLGDGDFRAQHDPLADAGDMLALPDAGGYAVDAPVDEHAKLGFAPPVQARVLVGAGALPALGFEVLNLCHGVLSLSPRQNCTL